MYQKRMTERQTKERNAILHLFKLLMAFAAAGAFAATWGVFYAERIHAPYFSKGNYAVCLLYLALYIMFARLYGGFQLGISKVSELIYSQVIALLFTNTALYSVICLLSYRLSNPLPILLNVTVTSLMAGLWCVLGNRINNRIFPPKRTVVIYDYLEETQVMRQIDQMTWKFNIVASVNIQNGWERALTAITDADAVFISGVTSSDRNSILKYCIERGIEAYLRPKIGDLLVVNSKRIQLNGVPVLCCTRDRTSMWYIAFKRALDIIAALAALILASPFMLITALAIKLQDGGPVLYKQRRLTKDGREFNILKFRSMKIDAEKDGVARLASKKDDRITPFGKVIRAIRMDELPQMINILKGDMSLVGPRPERPEIAERYAVEIPEFSLRLQVKAGLTGYAQVYGKYNSDPYDKLQMDLIYIANQSITQDLKLMLATVKVLFWPESTEGVGEGDRWAINAEPVQENKT